MWYLKKKNSVTLPFNSYAMPPAAADECRRHSCGPGLNLELPGSLQAEIPGIC